MRTIEQIQIIPPTLVSNGSGGKAHQANLAIHNDDPTKAKKFSDHWNKPDVRGFLYANQGRVCAYCCRGLPGGDRGDVEHFRPKKAVAEDKSHGGYWWLAYNPLNYVLSCRICNSSRKGNKFPLQNNLQRATFETDFDTNREIRLLTHPKEDDLDQWFAVDLDHRLLRVLPRDDLLTPEEVNTALETLRFFRINSDQFLIRERFEILDFTIAAIENEDFQAASRLASRFRPQSLVARQVLLERYPEHLPNRNEELKWLLEEIVYEFDSLSSILELNPNDERSKHELSETMWMLASLRNSYPDENIQRVIDLCEDLDIGSEIDGLASQMVAI